MSAKIFGSAGRGGRRRRHRELAPKSMGFIAAGIAFVILLASFHQDEIASLVTPHDTVTVEFPRQFKLVNDSPYASEVKIAGVIVGKVGEVERTERNTALVALEVEDGTLEKLGNAPSAAVVAKLVVAGNYFVELTPGGMGEFQGDVIPPERTRLPVELEDVIGSISTPDALNGVQAAVGQTTKTLQQGGRDAVRDLAAHAPATLRPAGVVLGAMRGTQPESDLTTFVRGFESTAKAFNRDDEQVKRIITSLDSTTAALAAGSRPLSDAIADGTETLRVTRAGLADLQPTLDELTTTATEFRESAQQLDPFLRKLNPVLDRAEPVVADLREVTEDLRPIVDRLVPTASEATDVLKNLEGPALDGLNGQIQEVLYAPWHGTGVWQGGGADRPLFKEVAYLMVDIDAVMSTHDRNIAMARLHAAAGGRSVGGQHNPRSLEQYLESFGKQPPKGPQEDAGPLGSFGRKSTPGDGNVAPGITPPAPKPAAPLINPQEDVGGSLPLHRGGR